MFTAAQPTAAPGGCRIVAQQATMETNVPKRLAPLGPGRRPSRSPARRGQRDRGGYRARRTPISR
jgi:hypothetical protein